ncbi:11404_t:CDS:2 [Dentiscutata erythropus]|uniref:11404_t:CDS:1 n=1 Tax=Dentiscutata erythropus TaxID=1348616 RepID=A0A9N9G880_9GLOM|nr:11404_t:CDS:2 [Dentiscutata erythropus]
MPESSSLCRLSAKPNSRIIPYLIKYTKISLQNFSNDEYAYLVESQLLLNEEYSCSLSKESSLLFDEQQPLSLDKNPLLLDDDFSSNKLSIYSKPVSDEEFSESSTNSTQNTITEVSKPSQQNIIVWYYMKKDKPAKMIRCRAWIGSDDNLKQCTNTFKITSTTNLASHFQTIHRLSKTGPLSGGKEVTQLQPVQLDPSQPTLLELVNRQTTSLSNKKQNRIISRILA